MLVNVILIALILNPYFSFGFPADEVTHLPGLAKQPAFKHYSGYLNATKGRYYHYWFVESQSNPTKDPVILWLNGGPGCSSLDGLFTENGPFRVKSPGKVTEDPNSWNTIANVLYLESPVGVGFSYTTEKTIVNNDDSTAEDNYLALKSFFKKFPQFSKNAFYITGESYAGVYIPMLAIKIYENNLTINLKGVAIGNGALDTETMMESTYILEYSHTLIDSDEYNQARKRYCWCSNSTGEVCDYRHPHKKNLTESDKAEFYAPFDVNPYNILDDCPMFDFYSTDKRISDSRLYTDLNTYYGIDFDDMKYFDNQYYSSKPECLSNDYNSYLRDPAVRKAIHIPDHVKKWVLCGGSNYTTQDKYSSMTAQFKQLIEKYKIPSLIVYNGDLDTMCDFIADQMFVDRLGYKITQKYQKWMANGRVAGFVKRYGSLSFMTVRGAGHMVPSDQPEAALQIVKELIGISKVA